QVQRDFPMPGSFGFVKTTAYGPFVVQQDVLLDRTAALQTARVVAHPRLEEAGPATLAAVSERVEAARATLFAAIQGAALGGFVSTDVGKTVEGARTQLAVTRVGLAVLGIML